MDGDSKEGFLKGGDCTEKEPQNASRSPPEALLSISVFIHRVKLQKPGK